MESGRLIDLATQRWVRSTGRRIDLSEYAWLDGPTGDPQVVGDTWVLREAARLSGRVVENGEDGGLLPSLGVLAGDGFDPLAVRSEIADFYARTVRWRLELWSQWAPLAWPFGWLLTTLFARRLQQLSLPLRPLDVSRGVDSRVVRVLDGDGSVRGAAWVRTLRATSETVYSGWYGAVTLPGHRRPSIRVVFPLPNGSITVFLRPEVTSRGDLRLRSPLGRFGDDGAYLLVREPGSAVAWARRVPLVECFDVYVDDEGLLRTDHELRLWGLRALRLHYRLEPRHGQAMW